MKMMIKNLAVSGAILFFASNLQAEDKIRMEATTDQEALSRFADICVASYLDKEALLAKLHTDKEKWLLHTTKRPHDIRGGIYLESKHGEIGHVSQHEQSPSNNDPACHFTFITDKKSSHNKLVSLVKTRFGLSEGKDTTSKIAKQVRWDFQNVGAAPARFYVTIGLKANGRTVSRFSISRHRTPKPAAVGNEI